MGISDNIEAALKDNPDPTVQTHEFKGRRVTRFSPKELLEAQGMAEARAARAAGGMFRAVRVNKAGSGS